MIRGKRNTEEGDVLFIGSPGTPYEMNSKNYVTTSHNNMAPITFSLLF